jgi:hypothetical protein
MRKQNGKKAVIVVLSLVFGVSLFAWIIQKTIYANKGKPVEGSVEQVEDNRADQ